MEALPTRADLGYGPILIRNEMPSLTLQVLQSTDGDAFTASPLEGLRAKQRKRSPISRPPDGELNQRNICIGGRVELKMSSGVAPSHRCRWERDRRSLPHRPHIPPVASWRPP